MASDGILGESRPNGILANTTACAVCIISDLPLPAMGATRRLHASSGQKQVPMMTAGLSSTLSELRVFRYGLLLQTALDSATPLEAIGA